MSADFRSNIVKAIEQSGLAAIILLVPFAMHCAKEITVSFNALW